MKVQSFFLVLLLSLSSSVFAGPRVIGNGRNPQPAAHEFVAVAKSVLLAIKKSNHQELDELMEASESLLIGSSKYIESDLEYHEELGILMVRSERWLVLKSHKEKSLFVLRGILLVMGIDYADLERSNEIIEKIGLENSAFTQFRSGKQ